MNYLEEIIKILGSNQNLEVKDGIAHIQIKHDKWCDIFKKQTCNCNPNVKTIKREKDLQ